ncbi:hypothetical protein Lgra_0562 [Legionella gratiana]|uniref:Uncharacterized protein n=1 Tax=Legionella gratiana TaxID=45066 RepID=A0A378J4K4_9GAMM|nr:hypothetical protein [Legionella gratiana]KTD14531.1 hypothetical protein Lgra_0562 [Legionella gratiana]STX41921.1 Uncharacterised protein [Legionella gratiana]
MPKLFKESKKPDPKKNFFQNYSDHLDYLQHEFEEFWIKLEKTKKLEERLNLMSNEALKRLNIFERLRDGHDYMDEVVGATALPALGMIVSIGSFAAAVWEGAQALAIHVGLTKKDGEDHKENAANFLLLSAASFALSVASFLKSAISLISRPIITAFYGYAKQDIVRFHNDESIEGYVARM